MRDKKARKKSKNSKKLKFGSELGSLKNTPMYNGVTSYGKGGSPLNCPDGMGKDLGINSLDVLEKSLNSFGSKRKSKKSKRRSFVSKRKSKKSNKSKRKFKKSRKKFGSLAFENGVIPNSNGYPPLTPLGLPEGGVSVNNIYQTFPNPMIRGAPLPDFGKINNTRMKMLYNVHGFGLKKKRKSKRKSKKSKRKSRKKFGTTPGTSKWITELGNQNFNGINYARPYLMEAKGDINPEFLYYQSNGNSSNPNSEFGIANNVPMQFSDNQLNTPLFTNKFGGSLKKILKRHSKKKARKSKRRKSRKSHRKSRKSRKSHKKSRKDKKNKKDKRKSKKLKKRSFGAFLSSSAMTGPNNVAYRQQFPMGHAGGNTVNFATGELYYNMGKLGGPTNSTEPYASVGTFSDPILKVQPDGMTPNAYLNTAAGLKASSSGFNTARSFTHNGLSFGSKSKKSKKNQKSKKSKNFGSQMYSPPTIKSGTGNITISQPEPPYMSKNISEFGKKKVEKRKFSLTKKAKPVSKPLKNTKDSVKTITLSNGKISIE